MPRTVNDAPLTTRAARARLAAQHAPYWRAMEWGAAIGYRKGSAGGMWLVRLADPTAGGGYRQATVGRADDGLKAAGEAVLDWRGAEAAARAWIAKRHRIAAGLEPEPSTVKAKPAYTIADAIADYIAELAGRGSKGIAGTHTAAVAHILPTFGDTPVARITRDAIRDWHRGLADKPPRLRVRPGRPQRYREPATDPDAIRRRRSTANRVLTVLKAALNHAKADGRVTCPADAWATVKPFREADAPKIRYLTDDELVRLVNACSSDFRALVSAALLTGARYGELTALRVASFDPEAGTLTIDVSKSGKARHIALSAEGVLFFKQASVGKLGSDHLFARNAIVKQATRSAPAIIKRRPWRSNDQHRSMREACAAARIEPAIGFHILRHSYASKLARAGVPMPVIAQQLGHAGTRMTERHYAHLGPSYVRDVIRAGLGTLGIVPDTNVVALQRAPSAS